MYSVVAAVLILLMGCSAPVRTLAGDDSELLYAPDAGGEDSQPLDTIDSGKDPPEDGGAAPDSAKIEAGGDTSDSAKDSPEGGGDAPDTAEPPARVPGEYDRVYCIRRITSCGSSVSTEGCLVMLADDPAKAAFRCSDPVWQACLASVTRAQCSLFSPTPWRYLWTAECEACR